MQNNSWITEQGVIKPGPSLWPEMLEAAMFMSQWRRFSLLSTFRATTVTWTTSSYRAYLQNLSKIWLKLWDTITLVQACIRCEFKFPSSPPWRNLNKLDFRFSQQCLWWVLSCGMMTPCSLVEIHWCFKRDTLLCLAHSLTLECQWTPTRLHRVTSQKTVFFII
jgi:hypothetical protein